MHHALHIQEILLDIFGHCCPPEPRWTPHRRRSTTDLAALARTCRTFKEPALDVLWSELVDLTPLPQCVPEACGVSGKCYSFKRRLNEEEWRVLHSYTRRVWHILGHAHPYGWLDNDTLIMICKPPVAGPLFPNLRTFFWQGITMIPAVHIAAPSLTTICLQLTHDYVVELKGFLETVGVLSPNVNRVRIYATRSHSSHGLDDTICSYIRRLASLRILDCRGIILDADMMSHLSKTPTLKHLSLVLNPPYFPSSFSALMFPALTRLETSSQSLETVAGLLSYIRLLAVEDLNAVFYAYPLQETLRSCMTTLQSAFSPNSLSRFRLYGIANPPTPHTQLDHRLTLDDIRPCMALVNLSHIHINLPGWSVDLTDGDLLMLVSTLPHIQTLRLNDEWGWGTTFGITLRGLSQLLRTRPSLSHLCISIYTGSYADIQHEVETRFLPPQQTLTVDLADSPIQSADVPKLVEAFCHLGLHTCVFSAWGGTQMKDREGVADYRREWHRVFDGVTEALGTA